MIGYPDLRTIIKSTFAKTGLSLIVYLTVD